MLDFGGGQELYDRGGCELGNTIACRALGVFFNDAGVSESEHTEVSESRQPGVSESGCTVEFLNRGNPEFLNRVNPEFLNRERVEFLNRDICWSF